jgi:DnaJ-class molecular chaperone
MPCSEERRQLFGSNVGRPWRLPRDQWPGQTAAAWVVCPDCAGTGILDGHPCEDCDGVGGWTA